MTRYSIGGWCSGTIIKFSEPRDSDTFIEYFSRNIGQYASLYSLCWLKEDDKFFDTFEKLFGAATKVYDDTCAFLIPRGIITDLKSLLTIVPLSCIEVANCSDDELFIAETKFEGFDNDGNTYYSSVGNFTQTSAITLTGGYTCGFKRFYKVKKSELYGSKCNYNGLVGKLVEKYESPYFQSGSGMSSGPIYYGFTKVTKIKE